MQNTVFYTENINILEIQHKSWKLNFLGRDLTVHGQSDSLPQSCLRSATLLPRSPFVAPQIAFWNVINSFPVFLHRPFRRRRIPLPWLWLAQGHRVQPGREGCQLFWVAWAVWAPVVTLWYLGWVKNSKRLWREDSIPFSELKAQTIDMMRIFKWEAHSNTHTFYLIFLLSSLQLFPIRAACKQFTQGSGGGDQHK